MTEEDFEKLLPLASAWAERQEDQILKVGVPLSPLQLADASLIGISQPERIRLARVPIIPMPDDPILRAAAIATGLISPETVGLTVRYGIFIRADQWGNRALIFHELVHTLQYERFGSFDSFLRRYLKECITIGYPAAPLEQEAVSITSSLLRLRI